MILRDRQRARAASTSGALVAAIVACTVLQTSLARAHPLGNFSTNHFARIRLGTDVVTIHYVVDMAEITTFQEIAAATGGTSSSWSDRERAAYLERTPARYLDGLSLTVDGVPVSLQLRDSSLEMPEGVGGQPTLRVTSELTGRIPALGGPARFEFEDTNHAGRTGWHELVVDAESGIAIFDSTAFADGVSDELRNYPSDVLMAPLQERTATWSAMAGTLPIGARPQAHRSGVAQTRAAPRGALRPPALTATEAAALVLLVLVLGGLHAIVLPEASERGRSREDVSRKHLDAAVLGRLRAAVTELSAVVPFATVTWIAAQALLPSHWQPMTTRIAGGLIAAIGVALLVARSRNADRAEPPAFVRRSARLVVILAGVAVQHVAFAFVLLAAFGAGMIGAPFPGRERTPRVVHRAALAHACIIAAVGVAVCLTIAIRSPPPR